MSKRVEVKICTGTLCYVMGGAELQLLDESLTPEQLERVDIKGSPCLECCTKGDASLAPFAMVNGRIVSEATISKVVDVIKEELNA